MGRRNRHERHLPFFFPLIFFSIAGLLFPLSIYSQVVSYQELVAAGDLNWHNRAVGADGWHAQPASIDEAIRLYREAIEVFPNGIPARWRLMQALYFKGEFTGLDRRARRVVYDEGIETGNEALELIRGEASSRSGKDMSKATPEELADFFSGESEVAATFFWHSVQWGQWALNHGKLQAARKGVASKIRDLASGAATADPAYRDGGGYRVLGRLHAETPRIPFITGWVSRDEAVTWLRRAVESGPDEVLNSFYLADILKDRGKVGVTEAVKILEELLTRPPRPAYPVEDRKGLEDARLLLEKIRPNP